MSKVTINGNVYNVADPGTEAGWGEDTTGAIVDLANVVNSLTGTEYKSDSSAILANNTGTLTDVPSLAFTSANTRNVTVKYSILVNATTDLTENGVLNLHYDVATTSWKIQREFTGDDSKVILDVTSAGQVQYKTPSYPGHVSITIYFKTESMISV